MKSFMLSFRFLFVSFLAIQLALCSNDNKNEEINTTDFEAVTIDLSAASVTVEDMEFQLQGFSFKVVRAESTNLGGDGILLAFPGENGEFSSLELDLSNSQGISKISLSLFNNCSACLDIQVLNDNQIVTEIKGTELESGINMVEIDVNSNIDVLRVASLETTVNSIKLE